MSEKQAFHEHLKQHLSQILGAPNTPVTHKASVISNFARTTLDQFYDNPTGAEALIDAKNVVSHCVDYLSSPENLITLINMIYHDSYTFAHSLGVSAHATMLYRELYPQAGAQDMFEIALTGLLHDIGKHF